VEALQFQVDLVRKHQVAPEPQPSVGYEGPANLFIGRKVAMITTGPWNINPIRQGAPDLNWTIALPLEGKVRTTYAAGTNMSISKDSQNKELAWEVIKRLTRPEVEAKATAEAGMLMPRKSWAKSAEVAADPLIQKWADIMVTVPLHPIFPYDMLVSEVYEKMFQEAYDNAMFGKMSAQEALDQYVQEGNLKLKQALN
jgi:multiple sugar transport system substrate-binding protein